MQSVTSTKTFERPFPALTPAQRYYFDVFGYVVVPDLFTRDEIESLKDSLQRLKRDLLAQGRLALATTQPAVDCDYAYWLHLREAASADAVAVHDWILLQSTARPE